MTDDFQLQKVDPERLKPVDMDEMLTTGQAGKILGLTSNTVRRMCIDGEIEAVRYSDGGHWRIPRRSVMAFGQAKFGYGNADDTVKDFI